MIGAVPRFVALDEMSPARTPSSHTSVALHDAVKAISIPVILVHLTDPATREPFRHTDLVALAATQVIKGQGARGYLSALDEAARL